jgi:hypothetical protein
MVSKVDVERLGGVGYGSGALGAGGMANGRDDMGYLRGESNGMAKLTEDDVRKIRALRESRGFSQGELAIKFGGRSWGHVTV